MASAIQINIISTTGGRFTKGLRGRVGNRLCLPRPKVITKTRLWLGGILLCRPSPLWLCERVLTAGDTEIHGDSQGNPLRSAKESEAEFKIDFAVRLRPRGERWPTI